MPLLTSSSYHPLGRQSSRQQQPQPQPQLPPTQLLVAAVADAAGVGGPPAAVVVADAPPAVVVDDVYSVVGAPVAGQTAASPRLRERLQNSLF